MSGLFLVSYVVAPVLMLGCCLGVGLLVRRLAGRSLPALYVLPLGFAAIVAAGAFLTTWDATAELTGPAFVVLAIAGLVVERRRLRARLQPAGRWAWAAGGALAGYAVMIAPAFLSGRATFTGYARIVDIAHQFDFARYLVTEGRLRPAVRDSSYREVVTKTLDIGYPGGAQSVFGGFADVLGVDLAWIYQSFLALAAAMMALAVYGLLRGAVRSRVLRAVAAGIAAQANVLVGYGLAGGFKELVSASLLLLCAALVREILIRPARAREMLPLSIAVAGALGAFNLTIVPWLGLLLVGAFGVTMARGGRRARARLRPLGAWAAMAAMTVAIAAPTLVQAAKLAPVAVQAQGAERTILVDLGNLAAPMPVKAAAGVWISADIRTPSLGDTAPTTAIVALVLGLAALGVLVAARRRDWAILLLGGTAAVALAYFATRTGPWIQLKAIALTGPVVLALAFAGAAALGRSMRRRPLGPVVGWGLAGVVALGVLSGNALAYHEITLAPTDRLRDLQRIGERFADEGPALYPAHEEYAEYFLRRSDAIGLVNVAGINDLFPVYQEAAAVEAAKKPGQPFAWDLDDFQTDYLQKFRLLVVRRGPETSRPPSNFALAMRTRFHDVWRRVRPPGTVRFHAPLPGITAESGTQACRDLVASAREAAPGARLAYALAAPTASAELGVARISPNWKPGDRGSVLPYGPGWAQRQVRLPRGGTYRLWLGGPNQRELRILVDGKQVAAVEDAWSYPDQWGLLETLRLPGGEHTIRVEGGGGNLEPGDGTVAQPVGPVTFELLTGRTGDIRTAPLSKARELCADPEGIDWIEVVDLPPGAVLGDGPL